MAQRQDGKGESDQNAEDCCQRQGLRIKLRLSRDWQDAGEITRRDWRGDRSKQEACQDTHQSDQRNLDEIDQHHDRSRGAQAFERGDHGALGIEECSHGIGNADPAHDQCCQTHEGEKL